jgi:hypothetical protein
MIIHELYDYISYKLSGFSMNPDIADAATTPAFAK